MQFIFNYIYLTSFPVAGINLVDVDKKYLLFSLASKLYENGKLSLGQAAKMSHVSKITFMELLGDYGVSVFQETSSDLADDIKNA